MELENKLLDIYVDTELDFITKFNIFEFFTYRTLKLLTSKNIEEVEDHIDFFKKAEEKAKTEKDRGFFYSLIILLETKHNIGIGTNHEQFIKKFKLVLHALGLDEYGDDIDKLI